MKDPFRLAYLFGALLFVTFVGWKMWQGVRWSRRGGASGGEVRRLRAELRRALRDAGSSEARAASLRSAAIEALEQLGRPDLAVRWAGRAWRMDHADAESLAIYVRALREAKRWRTMERLLWIRIAEAAPGERRALLEELAELYDRRLRKPERARALRALSMPERAGTG